MVEIAFPADLAVGHDVDTGTLLIMQGNQGGVILGFFQQVVLGAPDLMHPHPRWAAAQQNILINKPGGLRITAYQRGRN